MGEAKRRGSHPPTRAERAVRWMNRMWMLYPRPVRTVYKLNAQIVGVAALVIVGSAVALVILEALLRHR